MTTSTDPEAPPSISGRNFDVVRWVLIAGIAISAFVVLVVAGTTIVRPLDSLVTEQACRSFGSEIQRPLIESQRSDRLNPTDRTGGFCLYGAGEGGEGTVRYTLDEIEPGALYTMGRVSGIVLQLGITSVFVRLVTDPTFALYRYLRRRFG